VPADVTVRRADPGEADLVGALTERVYRDGGFGSGAYADVLRDGRSRVRDDIVLVAAADGTPPNASTSAAATSASPPATGRSATSTSSPTASPL
jgi:MOSC domain-containing protein YiiM